jgi:hypothetical protein
MLAADAFLFHPALLAIFCQWLAAIRLHSMAPIRHFILRRCFLFFER